MPNPLLATTNRILPALVTPLTSDGKLDVASAEQLIDHLYNEGVGGLYVAGSTGEGIYLDVETRRKIVELSVKMSRGRGQVIAHIGAIEGSLAYELAIHAGKVGADAVASIPPFVGGYSWEELYGYYRRLCEVSSVPVVGYYIPTLSGQAISVDKLATLGELPNLVGFKVTDTNLYTTQRLAMRLRPDQIIYNGPDELLVLGLMMGAHGGIGTTYNFMPRQFLAIAAHVASGRLAEAVAVQKQVDEAIEALLTYQGLAATKQILVWQGLIASATCAAPRAMLTADQQADLRRRLAGTVVADSLKL